MRKGITTLLVLSIIFFSGMACSEAVLDRKILDRSLELGRSFLLSHQKEEGNFTYEYDWINKTFSRGDNQVRQAGAAWGIALIYQDSPDGETEKAIRKALQFFRDRSKVRSTGSRYVVYPDESAGSTGTVALCALTLIDFLRAAEERISPEEYSDLRKLLDEYLQFLVEARDPSGLWHRSFLFLNGIPYGPSSPYFDGESLLALVKAARYLDRKDLVPIILDSAEKGYWNNVVLALKKDRDSAVTKGYFQWASMAYFELADSGWKDTLKYGERLMELSHWMIDVHRTLDRTRNTAYAYEGIIPAYEWARKTGKSEEAGKFRNTIEKGLGKLCTWQVGSPWANSFIRSHSTDDPLAIGGVQNHGREPLLRIDVTQHQMHAVILARRYVFP